MSRRILVALVITILLTVTIMQNPEIGKFKLIFIPVEVPKLVVLTAMSVGGFLVGILVSGSRKRGNDLPYPDDEDDHYKSNASTLSDEDRDYISEP